MTGAVLRLGLPAPETIVNSYLVHDEWLIHSDRPALDAFVIDRFFVLTLAAALSGVLGWALLSGQSLAFTGLLAAVLICLAVMLLVRRLQESYTRYVITSFRVMRVSGVLSRHHEWIPWVKVTDLSFRQTFLGRRFGYATIRIESANEGSNLKDLTDLHDPVTFNRILVEMISRKQGTVASPSLDPSLVPLGVTD